MEFGSLQFIYPDWPVPANVKAVVTTRKGGVSLPPYDGFNLATHVGDDSEHVQQNRALLSDALSLPKEPLWLEQVHGVEVAEVYETANCKADACFSQVPGKVCVVMTADCLPVFFCDRQGTQVAVAHAGWKGLCDGVIEQTLDRFTVPSSEILAWLGPAIGPKQFEVGDEVREAFMQVDGLAEKAFLPKTNGKWLADIYELARQRLNQQDVGFIKGGDFCTVSDKDLFYSYRRDGRTGRMASLIWLEQTMENHSE